MNIPHKLSDLILYCIVVTGLFAYIGPLVVASIPISELYPNGKFIKLSSSYSSLSEKYDKYGKTCLATIILTLIFGILTVVCWFLGRPKSSLPIAWIFRIIMGVSVFGQFLLIAVAQGYFYHTPQDAYYYFEPTEEEKTDFYKWLNDTHPIDENANNQYPGNPSEPNYNSAFKYWYYNISYKTDTIGYKFTAFMNIDLFFDALVVVYWLGFFYDFSWFSGETNSKQSPSYNNNNYQQPPQNEKQQSYLGQSNPEEV